MPKNVNSASRLLKLLLRFASYPDNTLVAEAWVGTFDVVETNSNKKHNLVAERLGWMHRELEILHTNMKNTTFSAELYTRPFNQIEHALSIMLLGGQANQVKPLLAKETFVALTYCSEILPDEEDEISPDDLSEIKAKVDELRASLSDSVISPRLRQLIEHHIDLIERALAEYPIYGAKALREAARTGLGEIIEIKDEVKLGKNSLQVGKLAAVWKKFNEVADDALKVEKIAKLGQKAWDLLENFLN